MRGTQASEERILLNALVNQSMDTTFSNLFTLPAHEMRLSSQKGEKCEKCEIRGPPRKAESEDALPASSTTKNCQRSNRIDRIVRHFLACACSTG